MGKKIIMHTQQARLIVRGCLFGVVMALVAMGARAHETDQFSVPEEGELADLGGYLNELVLRRLDQAVGRLNMQIDLAKSGHVLNARPQRRGPRARPRPVNQNDPQRALDRAYSQSGVANEVWRSFGNAVDLIGGLERDFQTRAMAERYPDQMVSFKAKDNGESVYSGLYFPLDPRTVFSVWHASTLRAYDTFLGTDKVGHFTDMGYHYFMEYLHAREAGFGEEEAMARAVRLGTNGVFSEQGILGYTTSGAYSNADLASNYIGCLFYRNLFEPMTLKGQVYEPILLRDGEHWKLSDSVREDPQFFSRFIDDHYDEALNPSVFEAIIRDTLRKAVRQRCERLLRWYAPKYTEEDPKAFFERTRESLRTYYGQDYGHKGEADEVISIANTCCEP
jgi:hypothetical protein